MVVTVSPYVVKDVITKAESDGGQYRVFVDGKFVGLLPYHEGACVLLHERFNPLQLKEIEKQVRVAVIPQKIGACQMPPKPRAETKRPVHPREDFG